jgi:hypothetical protein
MYVHTIDIAHPPLTSSAAEEVLDNEVRQARFTKQWRVLKVIHGYGSSGQPGVLKEVVRTWSYRNHAHVMAVIPGEEYNIFNAKTVEMRKVCGQIPDPDLGASNPGVTMIWVK